MPPSPFSLDTHRQTRGQSTLEFSLLLALVVVVVIATLALFGPTIVDGFQKVFNGLQLDDEEGAAGYLAVKDDLLNRIRSFYNTNGHWPRSWGDYAYTDIGLDPADWQEPVEGIRWGPHGQDVGLGTNPGDPYIIYVDDLDGNTLRLYDNWRIWCTASDDKCYYHRVAPENEVDITTLQFVPR